MFRLKDIFHKQNGTLWV